MAGVFRRTLAASTKLISRQLLTSTTSSVAQTSLPISVSSRSLWKLPSSSLSRARTRVGTSQVWSKTCGCCSVHTEVDKEISKFLEKEIQHEESSDKSKAGMPKIQGFSHTANDSLVTLTRKMGNETVKVIFNVNGSTESDQTSDFDDQEQSENVQMVARPPFTVEIDKGTGQVLAFQCVFTPPDDLQQEATPQDAEAIVDQFEIHDVTLHHGEWKDTIFTVSSDTIDGDLYDLLMDMLDERGINDDFMNDFVEFSTAYEHGKYVNFLKSLKSFIDKE